MDSTTSSKNFAGGDRRRWIAGCLRSVLVLAGIIGLAVRARLASPGIRGLRAQGFAVTFADLQARYPEVPDAENGYVFYSVGADGRDDGGKEHRERYDQAYDVTFRVEGAPGREGTGEGPI